MFKDYKYRLALDSTLCARLIKNSAFLKKHIKEITIFSNKLYQDDIEQNILKLNREMINATESISNIIIDSLTILFRDASKVKNIEFELKKIIQC